MKSIIAGIIALLAATAAAASTADCTGFVVTENPEKNRCEFTFCNRPDRPEMIAFCNYPNSCIGGTATTKCLTPEGNIIPANAL